MEEVGIPWACPGEGQVIEQDMIPRCLHSAPQQFAEVLRTNNNIIFDMFQTISSNMEVDNPYTTSDFVVKELNLENNIIGFQIKMPEPLECPLSYYIYLLIDKDYKKAQSFTVEKEIPFLAQENTAILGSSDNKSHNNYGLCSLNEDEILDKCIRIFTSNH